VNAAVNGGQAPLIEVRASPLHGLGVFAARRIPRGTRVIEYLGERVSHEEADRRYHHKDAGDGHTLLFIRTIEPGEELTYDYQIQREADDPPDIDAIFACRCGVERCRGSMLWPAPRAPGRQGQGSRRR
jgi:SET domain-containing protein